ncbi:MAG: type VI secretion system tube protein Hcp [Candidatus Sumerlaeia bacterium]|nr:type VI secretion system tube protein Hcp [Candidatus Sumerlaeia bacterium]
MAIWTVCFAGRSFGQHAIYVKVEGIPGESTNAAHANWIDALSYSHRVYMPYSSTGGTGRVVQESLFVTKLVDRATPLLYLRCCSGQAISTVTLQVYRVGGINPKILDIALRDVRVTSVTAISTPDSAPLPAEEVGFSYGWIRWTYYRYDAKGSFSGTVTATWNVLANQPAAVRPEVMNLE